MKILSKLFIVGIACISLVSLKADDNKADKAKKNKELAELFFGKLLADPEALKPVLHKDFTFTYMGKIPDTIVPYGIPYDTESFYSKWLGHIPKILPDGIILKTTDIIADENAVAVRQKGEAKGKFGQYNNDYSWHFKFKEGKILSVEEFNSDYLVAKSLYGKKLKNNKKALKDPLEENIVTPKVELEKIFSIKLQVKLDPHLSVFMGLRSGFYPYTKGEFDGVAKGALLPQGGALNIETDEYIEGKTIIEDDITMVLLTENNEKIICKALGLITSDATKWKMRSSWRFRTDSKELSWLNTTVGISDTILLGDPDKGYRAQHNIYKIKDN